MILIGKDTMGSTGIILPILYILLKFQSVRILV